MDKKTDIVLLALAFLLGGAIAGFAVHAWHAAHPVTETRTLIQKIPVSVPVPAAPAPQLAGVQQEQVKCPAAGVKVYAQPAKVALAKEKAISQATVADTAQHVAMSTSVNPDDHAHLVTTLWDDQTGAFQTFDVRQPLPWLAKDTSREVSVDLLEKIGGPVVRIQARQDLFQVKAVHFHVVAGGDVPVTAFGMQGRPDAFVGVGVSLSLP